MNADLISYESMVAAKDSATYAFWSTCAAIVTSLASLATLGIAFTALDSWKEQERTKAKLEFKRSILGLHYALDAMPPNWSFHSINSAKARLKMHPKTADDLDDEVQIYFLKKSLGIAYAEAEKSWVMCGHLFINTDVENYWADFVKKYRNYFMRGGNKYEFENLIQKLQSELKII